MRGQQRMAINIKDILLEKELEDDDPIDKDRLFWHSGYLDDLAEKFGYDDNFTKQFWHEYYCPILYHCTIPERYQAVLHRFLSPYHQRPKSKARGLGRGLWRAWARSPDHVP